MNGIESFLKSFGIQVQENGKLTSIESPNNINNIEDYIMITLKGKVYYVYEVHRANYILKKEEFDKDKALIWALILYKKLNDYNIDHITGRKIRSIIEKGDEDLVKSLFYKFDSRILSIGEKQEGKLCFIKNNGKASITYDDMEIATEVPLARAYVAFYNYCSIFEKIFKFYYDNHKLMEEKKITKHEIVELYMGF